MAIFDRLRKVVDITDTAMGLANGAADIVDRFVQNPEEKQRALQQLREYELDMKEEARKQADAVLADRQGAREMAGQHGKLQSAFALTFLISFLLVLLGEIVFIGLIVRWTMGESGVPLQDWLQVIIASTLTGVLSYMASMLKGVVGFLFGGSAGGDDREARLTETLRNAGSPAEE